MSLSSYLVGLGKGMMDEFCYVAENVLFGGKDDVDVFDVLNLLEKAHPMHALEWRWLAGLRKVMVSTCSVRRPELAKLGVLLDKLRGVAGLPGVVEVPLLSWVRVSLAGTVQPFPSGACTGQ